MNPSIGDVVKELHGDLARKYRTHGAAIENIWKTLDTKQRKQCLRAGAVDGEVLKHSLDQSMGNVYKFVPELNLRDIAEGDSAFLLDLLKHRATKSLFEQYRSGVNDGPGDYAFIREMMQTKGLRHVQPFKDCYTFFMDEEYGMSIQITGGHAEAMAPFAPAIRAGVCIPQATGELILQRQVTFLQSLNIMIEDVLAKGSKTRTQKERPKKPDDAATTALSKLRIQEPPKKIALPDLIASAEDQRDSLERYLELLAMEPVVLAHAVNIWFFSRPELVPDEKGRQLPVHTDKYISPALFEAVHGAVKSAAIWTYICRLLDLFESHATDKVYRAIILQELSNVCQLEYSRTQTIFTRHVQSGTGSKWFKRLSNAYDNVGNARVTMKGNPEDLTRADPQLHYMLRLCQSQTNASKAVDWMKKLSELHEAHPKEREKLQEREADSLCDLAVIIGFIQDLSPSISMPSLSRKKGQMFVFRSQELDTELSKLKTQIDLSDFAVPIDNLLEPGMTGGALKKIDEFMTENAGSKMGFLYQDLIEDCLSYLQQTYEQAKATAGQKDTTVWAPTPQVPEERVNERKQKEKTRPLHSSVFDIAVPIETPATEEPSLPQPAFKVSASTAEVFSTLFNKSQSRGSVNWTSFEAAMSDLGFSVCPKFGSVYTFLPPDTMKAKKSFTVHRPHKSRIEGYLIPIFARRLMRVYGWGEKTFEVA